MYINRQFPFSILTAYCQILKSVWPAAFFYTYLDIITTTLSLIYAEQQQHLACNMSAMYYFKLR